MAVAGHRGQLLEKLGFAPPPRTSAERMIEKELIVAQTMRVMWADMSRVAFGGLASL